MSQVLPYGEKNLLSVKAWKTKLKTVIILMCAMFSSVIRDMQILLRVNPITSHFVWKKEEKLVLEEKQKKLTEQGQRVNIKEKN